MENYFQTKIMTIVGVIISMTLIIVSWFPIPYEYYNKIIYTLIGLIFSGFFLKLFYGFNLNDRDKITEILRWVTKENSSIEKEEKFKQSIAKDIRDANNIWLLANTATGFFTNYDASFEKIKQKRKTNRIITFNPKSEEYKSYITKITDKKTEKVVTTSFDELLIKISAYAEYKQCNSMPNFSLLIINPKDPLKPEDNNTKIYLFVKLNSSLLGKDPVILINYTQNYIYDEFIAFFKTTWSYDAKAVS